MKTIEITTAQQVTIEYELASFSDRFLAFVVDYLCITMAFFAFLFLALQFVSIDDANGYLLFFSVASFFMYFLLFELFWNGQTLGKKLMGIKVVKLNGRVASGSDYLLRSVFHLIDSLGTMGVVASILINSSSKRQRLGDITANTAVIKLTPSSTFRLNDILNINTSEKHTPRFPEVRQFTEKDMLLIKKALTRYLQFPNATHTAILDDLTKKICQQLNVQQPKNKVVFLREIIQDYITLTR